MGEAEEVKSKKLATLVEVEEVGVEAVAAGLVERDH